MTNFLTRKKDGQVFPTDSGGSKTEYRRSYDSEPSFFTKRQVRTDMKDRYRHENPENPRDHGKETAMYRKKLLMESNKAELKEKKKLHKKQKKLIRKQERREKKSIKEESRQQVKQAEAESKRENAEDKERDDEIREDASYIDGDNHDF